MNEVEILTFFGSREVYLKRQLEVGIEVREGPIKKRIKYQEWRARQAQFVFLGESERRI